MVLLTQQFEFAAAHRLHCPRLSEAEFRVVNPSVENIARVIWGLLAGQASPARLHRVRVWETPKTCAEYVGDRQFVEERSSRTASAPGRRSWRRG